MIRNKIDPKLDNLEFLNKKFKWIPGKENIRPIPEVTVQKDKWIKNLFNFYKNESQYILSEIFNFDSEFISGKLHVKKCNIKKTHIFKKNMFSYNVPKGTNHYVIWYSYRSEEMNDYKINNNIQEELTKLLNHNNFDFVWYENPKKSFSKITHYQVFWRVI